MVQGEWAMFNKKIEVDEYVKLKGEVLHKKIISYIHWRES
jgi:hypothetical protein